MRGIPRRVLARCQRTGRWLDTGLVVRDDTFERLARIESRVFCPSCAAIHRWDRHTPIDETLEAAGLAIEMEAQAQAICMATKDFRRAFEAFMATDLARAGRDNHGGTLAFLDLDRFKAINDRHGHAAGDAVLCQIALRLRPAARATDCLARLHGDEFVLAMPGATREQAETRLSELANRVEKQPLRFADALIPVGISYGLSSYDGSTDLPTLLRDCDRAMYVRKQARRDD